MKALIVNSHHQLELKVIPTPRRNPYQALVRILACGICSTTDAELIRGTQPYHQHYPCVLGHEAVGEVIAVGEKVRHFKVGDWVTRPAAIVPGSFCEGISSAWGGFAEYGVVTDHLAMSEAGDNSMATDYTAVRQNVLEFGKKIGLSASVLSIALAETYEWATHLPLENKIVAINGTGIAGLSLTLWASLGGAKKVIVLGRRNDRLALARDLGATVTVNIIEEEARETVIALSGGGVDCFIEATGAASQMETAMRSVKTGGTVGVYGVAPGGHYDLQWKWLPADIRILQHEPQEQLARKKVQELMLNGSIPVSKLMTHRWPLAQFQQAYKEVQQGKVVKGMLDISE